MNCNEKNQCLYPNKDYCECVKKSLKQSKKNSRDRNVNGTQTFLKKNNIKYIDFEIILSSKKDPLSFFPFRVHGHYTKNWQRILRY